ncbi:transglutaminase-like domain-containing protein [Infirmifilum uzonense]|uniref:transglutaminase-like domain-containing protein n=1 Tax=Infirmifilum uzonense TaxID=1550241 RepID=UPI000B174C38|nr:transglutaminase-like domain-containing protein [Infirmifilum uzonense]
MFRKVCLLILLLVLVIPRLEVGISETGLKESSKVTYTITGRFLLMNNNNVSVNDYVYISLPQNTTFQRSFVMNIEPKPIRFQVDEDGNVFAVTYIVAKPGEKIWINVTYRVTVTGYSIDPSASRGVWPNFNILKRYTRSTRYWDIYNTTIVKLAYDAAYSDTPLKTVQRLASWVVSRVNYQVNLGRSGSDHALIYTPRGYRIQGDCVEVADVFITMARSLGIPARGAYGFLLTSYKEHMWLNMSTVAEEGDAILNHWGGHMWPEVYVEPYGWIDVDMLDGMTTNVGLFSARHVIFGFEETKYYGATLTSSCIPSYMSLEYIDYVFDGELG